MNINRSNYGIWYVAGVIVALAAGAEWYVSYHWNTPLYPSWQLMTAVSAMWVISAILICIPTILEQKERRINCDVKIVSEIPNVGKISEQATKTVDSLNTVGEKFLTIKSSMEDQVNAALDQLNDARSDDTLLLLRNNFQKEVSERIEWQTRCNRWHDGVIEVYDTIQRTLELSDRDSETWQNYKRMLRMLDTICAARGLIRIVPQIGDTIDERLHRITSEVEVDDLPPESVAGIERWGYHIGDQILRPAEIIATPVSVM